MAKMWMVRGEGGRLYDLFRDRSVAAIGWHELAAHAKPGTSRKQLRELFRTASPKHKEGTLISGASQVWRFVNEVEVGDWVITYSPFNRTYLVGKITGASEHRPEWSDDGMSLARPVKWQTSELSRDQLNVATKNSLGSTLTVFQVPAAAVSDIIAKLAGKPGPAPTIEDVAEEELTESVADVESRGREMIKDLVNALEWDDMQELVAGILRAMGYKTQVSPPGSDRGKDIIASPDGFGFENPRIIVEVKHRKGPMGSQDLRSFIGGRHEHDRGLYVSTGGFSKEALYEADRATVPLTLWTLENLVRALVEHYDSTDAETKRLVPLKRIYWPA